MSTIDISSFFTIPGRNGPVTCDDARTWYAELVAEAKLRIPHVPELLADKIAHQQASAQIMLAQVTLARVAEAFERELAILDKDAFMHAWIDSTAPVEHEGRVMHQCIITVNGDLKREAEYRELFRKVVERRHIELAPARRTPASHGAGASVSYGPITLRLEPDGVRCKIVAKGTKTETVTRTEYEVVCE
jgi:hypothetical protein